MKIDVKKQVVDLDGCQIYYPELKQLHLIKFHITSGIDCHFDFGIGLYTTKATLDQEFIMVLEDDSIKYLYDDEDKFEKFLQDMQHNRRKLCIGPWLDNRMADYHNNGSKDAKRKLELFAAVMWRLEERYGEFPPWVTRDLRCDFAYCKYAEFYHVRNSEEAYNLLTSVLPDNRRVTEKRLMVEQIQKDEEEKERRQKAVNADFEKKYGSIPKLKSELIEWVHSDPGIYEANQKYNEYEKARKQVQPDRSVNGVNRRLKEVLLETAKAPYLEFYSKALICVKLYFHEIYDFYHGIEDERYRLPDDWDVQKALNYLCDAPTYPIARMKFYGAPSTREVDETIAEKRKTALQKYIQSMRMLFAQKGDFRDGEIPEQKKELVDWRDRKEPFQLALKKYFEYKENFEYVERVVSDAKLEEIKEAFADYLEFYQNAKVFISDYLNEINRKKDARKEIPQEDLDRALMYFYNTDSPEEAREAVKEKKYRESRQYGEKGEEEVEYALKWLVGDYIKLEKDASGKYGTKAIVLNNKDFVDEPQEFDHIVIVPQGVFNIETKNYTGKIIIDRDGNWIREQSDGRKVGERNPLQQSRRHEAVLRSIVGDDVPIISILAIANPKAIIQGAENSKVKLLKSDVLEEYISNYKGAVSYTKEKIQALADEIEKYRVSK